LLPEPGAAAYTADETAALDQIAEFLGDLPLALHLAGSYLARYRRDLTPAHYLRQLQAVPVLHHRSLQTGDDSPTNHELHVERTFALSYERLVVADPLDALARRLLAAAAWFAPGVPIPRDLLLASAPQDDSPDDNTVGADALERLASLGLLEMESDGSLRLHRLLAAFVQVQPAAITAQAAVEQAISTEANRLNQAGYPAVLLAWQVHLRHVTDQACPRQDAQAATPCGNLGYHLHAQGDYVGARPYLEQALAIRRAVLGEQHPDTARSLSNLGLFLQAQGDYAAFQRQLDNMNKRSNPSISSLTSTI
jgi:hypothetical protein